MLQCSYPVLDYLFLVKRKYFESMILILIKSMAAELNSLITADKFELLDVNKLETYR